MPGYSHPHEIENLKLLNNYDLDVAEFLISTKQFKELLEYFNSGSPGPLIEQKYTKVQSWKKLLSEVLLSKITYFELTDNYSLKILYQLRDTFCNVVHYDNKNLLTIDILRDKHCNHALRWFNTLNSLINDKEKFESNNQNNQIHR